MSRISRAAAQPMAMLPSTLSGSPSPPTAPASVTSPMKTSMTRCRLRARYGSAVVATAMKIAICMTGKLRS